MLFKVYNQNGKVKITKICRDKTERVMFSDLQDGEVVEIEVNANLSANSHKHKIGKTSNVNLSECMPNIVSTELPKDK